MRERANAAKDFNDQWSIWNIIGSAEKEILPFDPAPITVPTDTGMDWMTTKVEERYLAQQPDQEKIARANWWRMVACVTCLCVVLFGVCMVIGLVIHKVEEEVPTSSVPGMTMSLSLS